MEVLRLVAGGLSNRQIAATLGHLPPHGERHVQHVYTKIGVSTRAAAAMFAHAARPGAVTVEAGGRPVSR